LYRRTRSTLLGGDLLGIDTADRNSDEMRAAKRDMGPTWKQSL
jgi:hypothetical protein